MYSLPSVQFQGIITNSQTMSGNQSVVKSIALIKQKK